MLEREFLWKNVLGCCGYYFLPYYEENRDCFLNLSRMEKIHKTRLERLMYVSQYERLEIDHPYVKKPMETDHP